MKKVFLTALLAFVGFSGTAFAQFSQGTIAVGGGLSFSRQTSEERDGSTTREADPTTSFNLSPAIGYFIAEDLEVGVRLGIDREAQRGDNYSNVTTGSLFGPYARKYFSLGETTALFGEASMAIGGGKNKIESGNVSYEGFRYSAFSMGIAPGVMFRPATRLGIELTAGFLGYSSYKTEVARAFDDDKEITKEGEFGLSLDMSNVALGVKLFF